MLNGTVDLMRKMRKQVPIPRLILKNQLGIGHGQHVLPDGRF